ncbi:MAG: hypothetical protein IPK21_21200 [Haliscomenobacter sp.]|jgi:hypothetical protein|nr:hypothetical protein [Haliscomenobacter sp.]MBV6429826.1 hypothetical protein [Haliscomenobacter sp.]
MKYFLIILIAFLFFGCYESNHRENNKKELVEILTTILVFEQERIILDSEQKISAHSDSNKIFLIPGISYKSEWEDHLQYVLDSLRGDFFEINVEKKSYRKIVEKLCKKMNLAFVLPVNTKEFDQQIQEGKVFAVVQLYNIWLNKKKDTFFYLSDGTHRANRFLEASYISTSVFKKEKGKWVFEKEL